MIYKNYERNHGGNYLLIAITREVSPTIGQCEMTHLQRQPIDVELARTQHIQYERVLAELGCQVKTLSADPQLPDSVFVEDTAIVLNEMAVVTRPGADSRRNETKIIAEVLNEYRTIFQIVSPGTLDGGDVLQMGKTLYVGTSKRSNESGRRQLADLVSPFGYEVVTVHVDGCLHLKSAVSKVDEETLLINRSWVNVKSFEEVDLIDIDPDEPYSANALLVGGAIVYPATFPKTRSRLEDRGYSIRVVDVSELQKAEGAVTCCSLIFQKESPGKGQFKLKGHD